MASTGTGASEIVYVIGEDQNGDVFFHVQASPYSYVSDYGTFSTTVVAGVPEPSTWAMMILGFCSLGFMAYRRKQPDHQPDQRRRETAFGRSFCF
jgi:hypothetical protein